MTRRIPLWLRVHAQLSGSVHRVAMVRKGLGSELPPASSPAGHDLACSSSIPRWLGKRGVRCSPGPGSLPIDGILDTPTLEGRASCWGWAASRRVLTSSGDGDDVLPETIRRVGFKEDRPRTLHSRIPGRRTWPGPD